MGLSLSAYIEELHQRPDLIWPKAPDIVPLKVTPSVQPLPEVRAVTWSVYGTLLRIDQGKLLHQHPQEIRMQIALEKTIKEFNMWYSMTRKQGQPWEGLLIQYNRFYEELGMQASRQKGDFPEVDSVVIWKKIFERLMQKEYTYEVSRYGELEDLAVKVAYFFHASLQGVTATEEARDTLATLTSGGVRQGLIADGQLFTIPQLLHSLQQQGRFSSISELLTADHLFVSSIQKLRKPSVTLYREVAESFARVGIQPSEVLHVSHRLKDDLGPAKKCGFRTALYAADKNCCEVTLKDVRDPEYKPDRLISRLSQIRNIVQC